MPTITICASAAFYEEVMGYAEELEAQGYTVLVPDLARTMQAKNDFDVTHYKTWVGNADDYYKKSALIHAHFDKIAKGDAVLVVNSTKHRVDGYIGGNVLMEMGLAFHLKQPIFVLKPLPKESAFLEEILGMQPIELNGSLAAIAEHLPGK